MSGTAIFERLSSLNSSSTDHNGILKVSRTIADLDGREGVGLEEVSEAIGYRVLDRPG
jgi:magnesium chelatase family protein